MIISNFVAYVKQMWKNKPDTSTPLSADRLLHIEDGIKGNSDAIEAIAAAVVNQIVNDPDKIASMAALYAVNQKIGDVANLPNSAADVVTAITQQNSNLNSRYDEIINKLNSFPSKVNFGNNISEIDFSSYSRDLTFLLITYNSLLYVIRYSNGIGVRKIWTNGTFDATSSGTILTFSSPENYVHMICLY